MLLQRATPQVLELSVLNDVAYYDIFQGYTALHLACLTGHVGVVGLLLSRSTELLKVVDEAGQSCLHIGEN